MNVVHTCFQTLTEMSLSPSRSPALSAAPSGVTRDTKTLCKHHTQLEIHTNKHNFCIYLSAEPAV